MTWRELLAEVWHQPHGGGDKTVDVHLSWLRRKLGESAAEPRYLHTVRGVGVKLEAPERIDDLERYGVRFDRVGGGGQREHAGAATVVVGPGDALVDLVALSRRIESEDADPPPVRLAKALGLGNQDDVHDVPNAQRVEHCLERRGVPDVRDVSVVFFDQLDQHAAGEVDAEVQAADADQGERGERAVELRHGVFLPSWHGRGQ